MAGNYETYVPGGEQHENVLTRVYSGSVSAGGGTVIFSLSTEINLLGLVYCPAAAGDHEAYFAPSALATPNALGDDHIVYGKYAANGGESSGYGPYFPKASKGATNAVNEIIARGADGLVRVRCYYYETKQGQ